MIMTLCSMSATGSLNHIGYVAVMAHALSRFPESGTSTASGPAETNALSRSIAHIQ